MQLIEVFDKGVRHAGERACFIDAASGRSWTYEEASVVSHRVAVRLAEIGIGRGSRAAVLSANDPVAFMCSLGILRAGAAYVPLNVMAPDSELVALLNLTECEVLFFEGALAPRIDGLLAAVPSLREAIAIGEPEAGGAKPELESWMAPPGVRAPLIDDDEEAPAWIMGTGGTTGPPKGVVLSQRALVTQTWALAAHMPERRPIQIAVAPMTHAAGALTYPVLLQGGTTVVQRGFDPEKLLRNLDEHRPTRLFLPPTAIYALLEHPSLDQHDFGCLRHFIYGAAPMSTEKLVEAIERFGPVLTQFYGQAESPTICTFLSPEEHVEAVEDPAKANRLLSCGRPSIVAQVRILDPDGAECPTGEIGEITVRTPLRMSGYLNAPERTAEIDRGNGWQGTGDVGYIDAEGYVYIVDRLRDTIISGGFNVFPGEVEQVIWRHPAVRDCAVIGLPDERWGEAVTAVVELKDGESVEVEELIALCKEELGSIKAPKAVLFDQLPRSTAGKVLKRELRDRYWTGRARAV